MVPAALRTTNRERAAGRCEYCLVHEDDVLAPHEPDHIIAEQHGGRTTVDNLTLAGYQFNRFKGRISPRLIRKWAESVFLFNPRRHK